METTAVKRKKFKYVNTDCYYCDVVAENGDIYTIYCMFTNTRDHNNNRIKIEAKYYAKNNRTEEEYTPISIWTDTGNLKSAPLDSDIAKTLQKKAFADMYENFNRYEEELKNPGGVKDEDRVERYS